MKTLAIALIISLLTTSTFAEGIAQRDLSKVSFDTTKFFGGNFIWDTKPDRLEITCSHCASQTIIDLRLSASNDGTEERFRSGETTIENMELLCKGREPKCTLERVNVHKAIGWITTYPIGDNAGSKVVLFKDGDLLTIRAFAATMNAAKDNAEIAAKEIAPQIVGID